MTCAYSWNTLLLGSYYDVLTAWKGGGIMFGRSGGLDNKAKICTLLLQPHIPPPLEPNSFHPPSSHGLPLCYNLIPRLPLIVWCLTNYYITLWGVTHASFMHHSYIITIPIKVWIPLGSLKISSDAAAWSPFDHLLTASHPSCFLHHVTLHSILMPPPSLPPLLPPYPLSSPLHLLPTHQRWS